MSLLAKRIGIDLGSSRLRAAVRGEGVLIDEPSVVAVDSPLTRVVAIGDRAVELADHEPGLRLVRPLTGGIGQEPEVNGHLVQMLVNQVLGRQRIFRPEVMICPPADASLFERARLTHRVIEAGARQAWLIDPPLAAGMGAGLPVHGQDPVLVCDIGARTTMMAVISRMGALADRRLALAGDAIDRLIAEALRREYGLMLEPAAAEAWKRRWLGVEPATAGRASAPRSEARDRPGSPTAEPIDIAALAGLVRAHLEPVVGAVEDMLAELPAGYARQARARGLTLTGGGALLSGLDRHLSDRLGIDTRVAPEPELCVVRGATQALESFEVLKRSQLYIR